MIPPFFPVLLFFLGLLRAALAQQNGLTTAEVAPEGSAAIEASRPVIRNVVRLADVGGSGAEKFVVRSRPEYDIDGSTAYGMPDIKVQSSAGIKVNDLNAFVPHWRHYTQYAPGQRKYSFMYRAKVLEIPKAYAYTFRDDFIIADQENVYNVGGGGEKMEGWTLTEEPEGKTLWEAPSQAVLGFHRFRSLAVLVHKFSNAYFHWITEAMPRLMLYLDVLDEEQKNSMRYLVHNSHFARESLRLFGVHEFRQAVFYDPSAVYQAETMYVAAGTPCGNAPKSVLESLQKRLHYILFPKKPYPSLPAPAGDGAAAVPGVVVLVKRNSSRQMENFDEVVETIRSGLKTNQQLVLFDDSRKYSLISQYMMFNKAEMIIGAHGGGLTNIVWGNKNTKVIEILPVTSAASGRRARVCYASIAGSLGMDYTMIPVETPSFDSPIQVPVKDLSKGMRL